MTIKRLVCRPLGTLCALAIGLAGCVVEDEHTGNEQTPEASAGLTLGARGEEVEKLNAALLAQGYFPNASLAKTFPEWVPAVAEGPSAMDVFDERTAKAVAIFQAHHGLASTGVASAATLGLMMQPRCGNPVIHGETAEAKWHHDAQWSSPYAFGGTFTYRIPNIPPGWTRTQASNAVANAFNVWEAQAGVNFIEVLPTDPSQAIIDFGPIDGPDGILGQCYNNYWGGSRYAITIDTSERWVFGGTPSVNVTLVHEIGHMLGLDHSGLGNAIMFPSVSTSAAPATLADDDLAAVIRRYRTWTTQTGSANDIGVGRGGIWKIGTDPQPGGFGIQRFTGSSWSAVPGGAVRIAMGDAPWVVNDAGSIFERIGVTAALPAGNGWIVRDNGRRAIDIGVAAGRRPWIITNEAGGAAGNRIRRFNGSSWDLVDGLAVRVGVGDDGSVFVANGQGVVYERLGITSSTPTGTSWRTLPGLANNIWGNDTGRATDVAVARDGVAVVAGTADGIPFTFYRQEQPAVAGSAGSSATAFDRWMAKEGGGARNVAVWQVHQAWTASPTGLIQKMTTR